MGMAAISQPRRGCLWINVLPFLYTRFGASPDISSTFLHRRKMDVNVSLTLRSNNMFFMMFLKILISRFVAVFPVFSGWLARFCSGFYCQPLPCIHGATHWSRRKIRRRSRQSGKGRLPLRSGHALPCPGNATGRCAPSSGSLSCRSCRGVFSNRG